MGQWGFLRRRVRSRHWTLLALAAAALAARFFGWTGATPYVLAGVIVNLWWVMRFGPRDSAARMRAFSLAVCAVFPLMYPLRMLPILAVALGALSVTARRLASQPQTHFFSLTLHCLLVMLLLFFLLAGSFELGVVDARRSQFLNPAFDLDYTSVAKIVFLLFLQVLLPLVMVLGWLGCGLQRQRSLWWQMIGLLHLFYLMQLLGLTVSLYFDSVIVNESNSLLYFSLSKMVVVFFVYCGFQAALSVSHQLVWRSRESVDAPAPISEQLAYE